MEHDSFDDRKINFSSTLQLLCHEKNPDALRLLCSLSLVLLCQRSTFTGHGKSCVIIFSRSMVRDPGVKPGDYIFTMDNGTPIGFTEQVSDGDYTDIAFTGTFERNNQNIPISQAAIQISLLQVKGLLSFQEKLATILLKNANIVN
ncbi:MAG: hypothetical protein IMW88_09190 [Thermoflavifilum sp.]|uniref:hypothetical protein n=1 Tax=Thermoflavifilum sp. TaxID=1968839 RepID=UPI0018A5F921|nr:hypothetical protein [Thermoflavifilum sp.]QOR75510.1 MAG: hypothetical protein IMW88_09190 [Thermoflavifilum sp.]